MPSFTLDLYHFVAMAVQVPSMPLEQFQASNQALLANGGPWLGTIQQGSETVCMCNRLVEVVNRLSSLLGEAQKWSWCDSGYCLVSALSPTETRTSYSTSFTANISVVVDHYGGATSLDLCVSFLIARGDH